MKIDNYSENSFLILDERVALLLNPDDSKVPDFGDRELYVFVTNFNPESFSTSLFNLNASLWYLNGDLTSSLLPTDKTFSLSPNERCESDYFKVQVFSSTQENVSLKIELEGKVIYFCGDNGHFKSEDNKDEINKYIKILEEVGKVDLAFIPSSLSNGKFSSLAIKEAEKILRPMLIIPIFLDKEGKNISVLLESVSNTEIADIKEGILTV